MKRGYIMQNSIKLRALREIYDEDFKTQAALKYPNIPKGEIVEYLGEFRNFYGDYVKVLWNNRRYNTTWDKLEVINAE